MRGVSVRLPSTPMIESASNVPQRESNARLGPHEAHGSSACSMSHLPSVEIPTSTFLSSDATATRLEARRIEILPARILYNWLGRKMKNVKKVRHWPRGC